MRIAVISDIHGNLEAFLEVLADIDQSGVDEIICLGDIIGYGPNPEEVVQKVRALEIPTIMGNHELAVSNKRALKWFNPVAKVSLEKTKEFLSKASIQYIRELPSSIVSHGCRFVHGFPPDSVKTYLFQISEDALSDTIKEMKEKICFIGHTHMLKLIRFDGDSVIEKTLKKGVTKIDPDQRYIINIGSVGQPRDDNNNAKYVLYDTDKNRLELKYIPYDAESVAERIIAKGLPKAHARRLR
jgi:predicted phosphodiesterase